MYIGPAHSAPTTWNALNPTVLSEGTFHRGGLANTIFLEIVYGYNSHSLFSSAKHIILVSNNVVLPWIVWRCASTWSSPHAMILLG